MRRFILLGALFLLIVYGVFEARKLLTGPTINIEYPAQGSATSSVLVTVKGTAHNISFLTINDDPSYTNEDGIFVYRFSPPAGYTSISVAATDRFGRRTNKSVSINVIRYCPVK
jgi:hypothetical protein